MAKDLVGIFNLALSAVGTQTTVSLPTENSREAKICSRWYEMIRDQILRAAPWQSARDTAILALQATRDFDTLWAAGDPEPPWAYRFALPDNFLYPRYIDSFQPFLLGDKEGQPVMFTNEEIVNLVYTKKQEVPPAWDADLFYSIVHGLAAHICRPLSGKVSTARDLIEQANIAILRARVNTANENQIEYESVPDWLVARGVTVGFTPSRFIYQTGPLLSLGGATF